MNNSENADATSPQASSEDKTEKNETSDMKANAQEKEKDHEGKNARSERASKRGSGRLSANARDSESHEDADGDDESIFDNAALSEIGERFVDQVRERPYAAIATALGAGVLLGSVLSSRIGRVAIFAAGGYAVKELFGDRILEAMGNQRVGDDEDEDEFERAPSRRR